MLDTQRTLEEFITTKHFDFQAIEEQIRQYWKDNEIYRCNHTEDKDLFLIDTPPPYANGALHHGHAMSYTQLDIIARYHRMIQPTLLPLAFDDNGLPTERYTEKKYNISPGEHPDNFFDLCKIEAMIGIQAQLDQFERFGFSYHPDIAYRTIDERSIRIAQQDFLDLYNKGKILRKNEPQLYCTHCQTALAQADLETQSGSTFMHQIEFPSIDTDISGIIIGTTRPELIPAACAIFYHPGDTSRDFDHLRIFNPITREELPIISDELVDRETGTGIMMCATFGDQLDIELYRKHHLPNKTIIDRKGMLQYPGFEGMTPIDARSKIIKQLKKSGYWISSEMITHQYPACERCHTPMEIIESLQWNLDILSSKEGMLEYIKGIEIKPKYMQKRLTNWIEGLKWNWILSRQRFYGIPIPTWHCTTADHITIAHADELPILPGQQLDRKCEECGANSIADADVFDTWFASSLTPRILVDRFLKSELREPLAIRTQAHEIIRTWAFYTLLKQYLSDNQIYPWKKLLISGWGLGFKEKGKRGIKASKSSGSGYNPNELINKYSADALRYWAANARFGKDQYLMEAILNRGKKLQTKLFNAAKITLILLNQIPEHSNTDDKSISEALLHSMDALRLSYHRFMEDYDYADALSELEQHFWDGYCSNFIEQFKAMGYEGGLSIEAKTIILGSWKRYLTYFAPFLPFITEYLWFMTSKFTSTNLNEQYTSIHATDIFSI